MVPSWLTALLGLVVGLQPGKYCYQQLVYSTGPFHYYDCLTFEYISPSKASMTYNYGNQQWYQMKYSSVSFEQDKVILKRHGHVEGPELYPYFDVGFDLRVNNTGGVHMVGKKGKYDYKLTKDSCLGGQDPRRRFICSLPLSKRKLYSTDSPPNGVYSAIGRQDGHALHFNTNSTTSEGYYIIFDSDDDSFVRSSADYDYHLTDEPEGQVFVLENNLDRFSDIYFNITTNLAVPSMCIIMQRMWCTSPLRINLSRHSS